MRNAVIFGMIAAAVAWCGSACRAEMEDRWSGDVFAGYSATSGNTDKSAGSLDASASKKFWEGVFAAKARVFYSQSNKQMDEQKWDGLGRYSYDFGPKKVWYAISQVLAEHDRFADIDYRFTPSVGCGKHLIRREETLWDADASLGYEFTRYRVNTANDDETVVLLLHTFYKTRVLERSFISEDFTVIPGLEKKSGVRIRSTTTFSNPLRYNLDFEIKYIVDYDSEPAVDKTSTDKQLVAGIKYKF